MSAPLHEAPANVLRVPGDPAALAAFSGRDDRLPGDGNVSLRVGEGRPQSARAALLGALGLGPGDAVFMDQVHGRGVAEVGLADRGRGAASEADAVAGVDALVTRATDVALVVMVADCVPVLLVDPGQSVAAAHAGRRGVQLDVVGAALERMAPTDPGAVRAIIGPAIGGCCYEVPDALADEVVEQAPAADARTTWGTRSLDLPAALEARLRDLGVSSIGRVRACTRCGPGDWFSHRADPGAGRQAGAVCRRSEALAGSGRTVSQPGAESSGWSLDWSA